MKKRLKGGIVVSGGGAVLADVVLDGEKVAAVGLPEEMELLAGADAEVVDVSGCLLFPGFIDAHTHFDLHVAGTVTADDFYTGTKAAIGGGTTTIVDLAPSITARPWLRGWQTGRRRRMENALATTGFTCPSRNGTRKSAGRSRI